MLVIQLGILKIMSMILNNQNIIPARKVIQNNQEFLLGTFQIRQVRDFTKYTQHLIVGYDEVENTDENLDGGIIIKPIYNPEIQRKTNNAKVERIADFLINDPMAMFPTNIVISIPSEVIDSYQEIDGAVVIELNKIVREELDKKNGDVFLTIIDGQHRIKGIERAIERIDDEIFSLSQVINTSANAKLEEKRTSLSKLKDRLLNFELLVTFFIDPTLEYQAMIFATINKTQTKVPENLVYSLFGLTKNDSPQKTALEIVLALNGIEKSPFYNRIKLVGGNYQKGFKIPLSQATMVKSILYNISNNAREAETDRFKKRSELKPNPRGLTFRKYYAKNEDQKIVRILYAYFSAVRDTFLDQNGHPYWAINGEVTNVLQTNVGYQALLKVLTNILPSIEEEDRDKKSTYSNLLVRAVGLNFSDDGAEKRYPFTSSTISVLYTDLINMISPEV